MATVEQSFALIDGVSPALGRISKALDKAVNGFSRNVKAATSLEGAAVASGAKTRAEINEIDHCVNELRIDVENLDSRMKNAGGGAFGKMKDAISGIVGQFALGNLAADGIMRAFNAITSMPGRLIAASDEYSNMQARLRLVAGGQEKAIELNEAIFQSANRARGSYDTMVDSVAKIAMTAKEAFPDARQVVPFVEGIQKLFAVGGTDAQQAASAMLQLTQALGSGKLQGDEFRSIAEAAPLIEQMVARTMGVTQGQLKALSSEGKITADIIKRAIFENMDDINAMFGEMPMTFAQGMQVIDNAATKTFAGVYDKLSNMANGEIMKRFTNSAITGLNVLAVIIDGVVNNLVWLGNVAISAYDNLAQLGLIEPILGVLGAAFATMIAYAAFTALPALITSIDALGAALLASPLTWYVGVVAAVVGVFYLGVAAVNYFAGTSISATGLIFASFAWLGTMIMNIIKGIANNFIAVANFLGSVFVDPLGAIYNLFADIFGGVVSLVGEAVNKIIDLINKIPGMDKVGKFGHISVPTLERKEINGALWNIDSFELGNAGYNAAQAYKMGANGFNFGGSAGDGIATPYSYAQNGNETLDDIAKAGKDTAGNTGAIKDAMELVDEDLKYFRELANQEAVNRYTTASVNIDMGGISNTINSDTDIDGIMARMTNDLLEAVASGREAVTV